MKETCIVLKRYEWGAGGGLDEHKNGGLPPAMESPRSRRAALAGLAGQRGSGGPLCCCNRNIAGSESTTH